MIVTDLEYALENRLVKKLDYMIARCTQESPAKDVVLINEGGEGEGKTNSAVCEAYYVKYKTGREAHLFFKLQPMIDYAKNTDSKIIIWDEPSLDSLKKDHFSQANKDLSRLLMTARKKRHFLIINMTKFYKFDEYIVVDRSVGLIHMYSRKEIDPGRFLYIKRKNLEALYRGYTSSHKRLYKTLSTIRGSFPEIMHKHFDKMDFFINNIPHATLKTYEDEKDKAIASIGTSSTLSKSEIRDMKKLNDLKGKIANLKGLTAMQISEMFNIPRTTIQEWRNESQKVQNSLEKDVPKANDDDHIIITRGESEKNLSKDEEGEDDWEDEDENDSEEEESEGAPTIITKA